VPERSTLWAEAKSSLHGIHIESHELAGSFEIEVSAEGLDLTKPPSGQLELEADSLKTGNRLEDGQIESQLEVRKYPKVRGAVRGVTALAGGRYRVRGDLTLHGVTKSVEGDVTLRTIDDKTVEVEGEKVIDVREFGLNPPKILMMKVYPDVKIRAKVVAVREG
jgi:polyisoprenoid-binding protein YceI